MTIKKGQSASPAEEETDVTSSAATSTADDDTLAGSSPDTDSSDADQESQEDMASVIAEAMGPAEDDPDGDPDAESDDETDPDSDKDPDGEPDPDKEKESDQKPGEETDEEDDQGDDLPEGQRVPYNRFKKVIDQRNDLRGEIDTLKGQVEQYSNGHRQYQAITSFMRENNLDAEGASEALQIAALINSDPLEAMRMLSPIMNRLQQYSGEILPEDLQEQVDTGEISEAAARDIVRTRNENARLNQQRDREHQARSQQERTQQVQQVQQAMAQAANAEQQKIMQSDPDYGKKARLIRDRIRVHIAEKKPVNAEQAADIVRTAHKEITEEMRGLNPRKEMRPGPKTTDTGVSSGGGEQEPDTMLGAMLAAASNK